MQEKDPATVPDERLQMMFTCCHPAIEEKARVALALRTLGGLTTDEIAAAFLDKPATMAQRLVRAKQKIKANAIPYEIPDQDMLSERLGSVLKVIYRSLTREGYSARAGAPLIRVSLSAEAIRLARIMQSLMPDIPEISGLLALMLLIDSRRHARLTEDGLFVPLETQNRLRWDRGRIEEGVDLITTTLSRGAVGPYQLQAAIQAVHAQATQWNDTDWAQIVALYEVLYQMQSSPVVHINQAVAMSYDGREEDGLNILQEVGKGGALDSYQPYFAARADLNSRLGRLTMAQTDFAKAIDLSANDHERMFLMAKAGALTEQ